MAKRYTAEQIEFLRSHKGSYKQMRADFQEKYGREISEGQLDHLAERYGFRHGHRVYPHQMQAFYKMAKMGQQANRKEIGYTRVQNNSLYVKVRNSENSHKNFITLGRAVYEKEFGKIADDEAIIHLDKDNRNNDISNLMKIKKSELGVMNRCHYFYKNPEATKVGNTLAKIKIKARDRLKNG